MTLAGVLTGLSFDWVDGVLGNSIIQKVLPADTVNKNISQGNKGSWRGHMNALRRWAGSSGLQPPFSFADTSVPESWKTSTRARSFSRTM